MQRFFHRIVKLGTFVVHRQKIIKFNFPSSDNGNDYFKKIITNRIKLQIYKDHKDYFKIKTSFTVFPSSEIHKK